MSNSKLHWFTSSSGSVEFQLTMLDAAKGSHSGQCDDDIAELLQVPYIKEQLAEIDPQSIQHELKEYFFDSDYDAECIDAENNLKRILWIACGDIVDNADSEEEDA